MSEALVSALPASFDPAAAWNGTSRRRNDPPRLLSDGQRAWLGGVTLVLAGVVAAKALLLAHTIACHGTGEHLRQILAFHA